MQLTPGAQQSVISTLLLSLVAVPIHPLRWKGLPEPVPIQTPRTRAPSVTMTDAPSGDHTQRAWSELGISFYTTTSRSIKVYLRTIDHKRKVADSSHHFRHFYGTVCRHVGSIRALGRAFRWPAGPISPKVLLRILERSQLSRCSFRVKSISHLPEKIPCSVALNTKQGIPAYSNSPSFQSCG